MRTRFTRMMSSAVALAALTMIGAPTADAPDLYFEGFQAWKAGEMLMSEGKHVQAVEKLRAAEQKIAEVQNRFPDWQPDVVKYRLANIRKKLAELTPLPPKEVPPPSPNPPGRATPPMPTVKPRPEFFVRPTVPFQFNGRTYYKMLLSRQDTVVQAGQP
jgi:hypothetical protein